MSVETRILRDERFTALAFDQGKHIVQRARDGAIVTLGSAEDRVLVEGASLADAGGGRLLVESEGVLRVLESSNLRELRRIELGGSLNAARLVTGGVLFAQAVGDDMFEYLWSPDQGRQESFGQTRWVLSDRPALAADGRHLAWVACRQERNLEWAQRTDDGVSAAGYAIGEPERELARLNLDSGRLVLTPLPAPVRSLAVGDGRAWLLINREETSVLIGVWDGGDVIIRDLPELLGELTLVGPHAFAVQQPGKNHHATLWRIALDTGRPERVTTASEGELFGLVAGGGALHWLEGKSEGSLLMDRIFGGGAPGPDGIAVCTLDLKPKRPAPKKRATRTPIRKRRK